MVACLRAIAYVARATEGAGMSKLKRTKAFCDLIRSEEETAFLDYTICCAEHLSRLLEKCSATFVALLLEELKQETKTNEKRAG